MCDLNSQMILCIFNNNVTYHSPCTAQTGTQPHSASRPCLCVSSDAPACSVERSRPQVCFWHLVMVEAPARTHKHTFSWPKGKRLSSFHPISPSFVKTSWSLCGCERSPLVDLARAAGFPSACFPGNTTSTGGDDEQFNCCTLELQLWPGVEIPQSIPITHSTKTITNRCRTATRVCIAVWIWVRLDIFIEVV